MQLAQIVVSRLDGFPGLLCEGDAYLQIGGWLDYYSYEPKNVIFPIFKKIVSVIKSLQPSEDEADWEF
jgi:hypothetical protein